MVRLAGIKRGIYNPALPTLRKIDRDDVLCKLSDEHSRHTTFLDDSKLNDENYSQFKIFKLDFILFKGSFYNSSSFLNYPNGRSPLVAVGSKNN